jgi:mono/diheme cytochrome c family protein
MISFAPAISGSLADISANASRTHITQKNLPIGVTMTLRISCIAVSLLSTLCSTVVYAGTEDDWLDEFVVSGAWLRTENISGISSQNNFAVIEGAKNTVLYTQNKVADHELVTKAGFGDAWLKLDFMMTKNADAAIYLQGRYGIALTDSNEKKLMTAEDLGGLLHRSVSGQKVGGIAARTNAAKLNGEWQQLEIRFRAPRFDLANNKTADAFFLDVKINGELVQQNIFIQGFAIGAKFPWEERYGPVMLRVNRGAVAFKDIDIRHADYDAIIVPGKQGQKTNEDVLVDFVQIGKDAFESFGCASCHAVAARDASVKSGPNLYGLFAAKPREREVLEGEGHRFTITADRTYLLNSIRSPAAQLAVIESGSKVGEAYLPIMPAFGAATITDKQIDAMSAYLATLNSRFDQGPVVKLVTVEGPTQYDPLQDSLQLLVNNRVRIQRGPMMGVSGRSIHVGQTNGINYSFDPRILAVAKIWQGGFLDVSGEWTNRGGGGLKPGFDSKVIELGKNSFLVAPLNAEGGTIDFSFKEAVFGDFETMEESLTSTIDHLDRLKAVDAQFLGYQFDSRHPNAAPTFRYRVGKNQLALSHQLDANGDLTLKLSGELITPQKFAVNLHALQHITVSTGKFSAGVWQLPAGATNIQMKARLQVANNPWRAPPTQFDHTHQTLNKVSATAQLPSGYRIESYLPPKDNYARAQLFEALGIVVAEDDTLVVATRTAGIWRLVNGEWRLFAEGIFDSLGVVAEDKKGLTLVVGQKAELTRISDTNGDGLADLFETLYDAHSYHGNYHTYLHGPTRGKDGAFYFGLNLAHADTAIYKAGGTYMGATGGFSGWAIRVTPSGDSELWANGLRSPAGIATGPDGRIWYADNQGEFVSTSKMFVLRKNGFYGHPAGLVDLPGMVPDSPEIAWSAVSDKREKPVILFPHNLVANSPGNPAWDNTNGRFGLFGSQIFIGDQTQSNLLRVVTEFVNGIEQGVVIPFADGLESGVMRPIFLPDGSLLLGQTGRGWQAKGGHVASLQRIIWDGKTRSQDIYKVSAIPDGFSIELSEPLAGAWDETKWQDTVAVRSWVYRDAPDYGSEMLDEKDEPLTKAALSEDRKTLTLKLASTDQAQVHPQQTARVYHLQLRNLHKTNNARVLNAFYTLHTFPLAQ